jgi:hypothetical protein
MEGRRPAGGSAPALSETTVMDDGLP